MDGSDGAVPTAHAGRSSRERENIADRRGPAITDTSQYRNAVLTVGNGAVSPFLQRIPIPVVMWNPMKTKRTVSLRSFGSGILEVAGQRAAILVCYEQLLSWPILQSAAQHPTLIVSLTNDNWARKNTDTSCATSSGHRVGTALPASTDSRGESMRPPASTSAAGFLPRLSGGDASSKQSAAPTTLIGIDELSRRLSITKGTLYNWVYLRRIPFIKVGRYLTLRLRRHVPNPPPNYNG